MPSEISQTERDKCHMLSLACGPKGQNKHAKQKHADAENVLMAATWVGGVGGQTTRWRDSPREFWLCTHSLCA